MLVELAAPIRRDGDLGAQSLDGEAELGAVGLDRAADLLRRPRGHQRFPSVGAAFGAVAGAFALFALIYLIEALAWAINDLLNVSTALWAGFLITGGLVLVLGLIAGLIAMRQIKKGSPPTPQMAIEEGKLIKETVTSHHPAAVQGPRDVTSPREEVRS